MLISYEGMPNRTRIGVGTITFHKRRHMRGQRVFLMCKSRNVYTFYFHLSFFGNSASHSIEMIMLVSLVDMLTQTRIGVGSVTFSRMGPMRGQYVFLISKSRNLCTFSIDTYHLG